MVLLSRVRVILAIVFVMGLGLRLYHLGSFPASNQTADEFAWTWSGMTLLQEGAPRSWSWLFAYGEAPIVSWRDSDYRLVKPWLDHPPLYSLYMGAWMSLWGFRDIFAVDLMVMRLSSILLFVGTFWMFYLVLLHYVDRSLAVLTLMLFSIAPPSVLNGRLVVSEPFFLLLSLVGHYFVVHFAERGRRLDLLWVWLVAAALPLTKVTALSLSVYLGVLGGLRRNRQLVWAVCGGTILGIGLYLLYGWHFGAALFRRVLREEVSWPNGFIESGFGGFYSLLLVPRIVDKPFIYPPFLLGLFTLLWNVSQGRHLALSLQALLYAVGLGFFLGTNEALGWYLIPAYPLLCFGVADFVRRTWDEESHRSLWLWLLFSLPYVFGMLVEGVPGDWMLSRYAFVLNRQAFLLILMAVPLMILLTHRMGRSFRPGFAALLVLQGLADVWYVLGL